jgi:very-short-patch-repair endonuclease
MTEFFGLRAGTRILTPNPLSKDGEGASNSPSSCLGKGPGDGEDKAHLRTIESLECGDLVLTHRSRFMPILKVMQRAYVGEMLEIQFQDVSIPHYITPDLPVGTLAVPLPKFQARVTTARELRRSSTRSEATLWGFLRNYGSGIKFRRQHPMGPFVLDFYAPGIRLAIEVDGGIHQDRCQREYDSFRQEAIETCAVEFLRFSNDRLEKNVRGILADIDKRIKDRLDRFDHSVEWIHAGQFKVGMSVLAHGTSCQRMITSIQRLETSETVYNISFAEDHSYVTECYILRNCGSNKKSP